MTIPTFRSSAVSPLVLINYNVEVDQLEHSPMGRSALLTLGFLAEHGCIGLTKRGAFNRGFVNWAAEAFSWPGYTAEDLYALNKVLNESDFMPLEVLHDLMRAARLIRHQRGQAHPTKKGIGHQNDPGGLLALLFDTYFTAHDFEYYERWPAAFQDTDKAHMLTIFSSRCRDLVPVPEFTRWCLPVDYLIHKRIMTEEDAQFHVYSRLIRPLSWLGLLAHDCPKRLSALSQQKIGQTPLCGAFLAVDRSFHRAAVH